MKGRQWAFVLMTRTLAVFYCFVISGAMIVAQNDSVFKGGMHVQRETLATGGFGCLGLVHLYGMLELICRRPKTKRKTGGKTAGKPMQMTMMRQIQRHWKDFNDSGALLVVAEMIEIPLQTTQCGLIHAHTVSQAYALMHSSILVLNCWVIAHPQVSLHLCLLVDIVLDLAFVLLP